MAKIVLDSVPDLIDNRCPFMGVDRGTDKFCILRKCECMCISGYYDSWSGFITESTGITDHSKLTWMSNYCAFHNMNEKQNLKLSFNFNHCKYCKVK